MTGMPERIWANEIYDPDWRRIPDSVWDRDPWVGAVEYIRADIVAEKDAEIERLKKALEQAIATMCVAVQKRDQDWAGDALDWYQITGGELAAYLRERESKEEAV